MECNEGYTVTFCDRGENHIGNQQIGSLASKGFTFDELLQLRDSIRNKGRTAKLFDLGDHLQGTEKIKAGILVVPDGITLFNVDPHLMLQELQSLTFDKKALMYGTVRNKNARHNLCFGDVDQEPKYNEGKGTIVSFSRLTNTSTLRNNLSTILGEKAKDLVAEANHYYDINKCGIGYHGDSERRIVIGFRFGQPFPLCFRWYKGKEIISQRMDMMLYHGDMYIMDEKACGHDFKKRTLPTLRHAAGCEKYIK